MPKRIARAELAAVIAERSPRLNDSEAGLRTIDAVVERELQGWI